MADPLLSEVVSVAARFRRSASLEADYGQVDLLTDYIVSPLAIEVTTRICKELGSTHGNRAWTLVGPYGSGKSSFLTFLASILSDDPLRTGAFQALRQVSTTAMQEVARARGQLGTTQHLIPVVVTGSRRPLGPALLKGMLQAGERCWGASAGPEVMGAIRAALASPERSNDSSLVADLCGSFATEAQSRLKRAAGVMILIDEMGKFLEYAAQSPAEADIYLLQQVAEIAARIPGAGLSILTVLHQDFEAYASGLTASAQAEWTKVRGRYETIAFLESAGHLLKLMAHAIDRRAGANQVAMFRSGHIDDRAEAANALAKDPSTERARNLESCFPLNPVTALCLGPLFRLQLGQNERSLFSFLGSSEPGGFQSYLKSTDGRQEDRPYCLDNLYDYVVNNTSARAGGAGRARIWAATEEALHRLPRDSGALDERILKALAVLTATREGAGLDASKQAIAVGLNEEIAAVEARLKRLREASILIYRKYKQSYQVWDGSDLDIDDLIARASDPVRRSGSFAEQLQQLLPPLPVVASRHYHQRGTFRYFEARYVGVDQVKPTSSDHGDGVLLYVVPDRVEQLAEAEEQASVLRRSRRERPCVVVLPNEASVLLEALLELLSIQHVLGNTPELEGDPIARRELDERREIAMDRLSSAVARAYASDRSDQGGRWFHNGEPCQVNGRPSSVASAIFDEAYRDAPRILNELVNREELSSAAAAARHSLMKLMLSAKEQPQLGIEGHPPELSLYRSVLAATGLHRQQANQWTLSEPSDDGVRKAFAQIIKRLDAAKGKPVTFELLVDELRRPPLGIRPGVSLILLFAWYLLHEDAVFLYEDGGLVPVVSEDLVHRLLRAPAQVAMQSPVGNRGADQAVKLLLDYLQAGRSRGSGSGLFDVVRAIILVIRRLSPYAAQTSSVSKEARQVRIAVTSAKDPVHLLWTGLPLALGFNSFDQKSMAEPGMADRFATALIAALGELQGADRVLQGRIEQILRDLLRFDENGGDFYGLVKSRAQALGNLTDLPAPVRRWVSLAAELDPESEESRALWLSGIATVVLGKMPRAWADADVPRFGQAAMELCRAYLGAEELALESRKVPKGSFRMIRVSVLDAEGHDTSGVALLRQEDAEKVRAFRAELREMARRQGIVGRELAYAVIADMMEEFNRSSEEESQE